MRLQAAFAVFALLAAGPAHGADCGMARDTVEINQCADKEYTAADAELNAAYKTLLAKIAKTTGDKPYDAKSWEAALRASQRAWIAFRDAQCKGLVPMEWGGGSGSTFAVLDCLTRLTRERVTMLGEHFSEAEGPARVP